MNSRITHRIAVRLTAYIAVCCLLVAGLTLSAHASGPSIHDFDPAAPPEGFGSVSGLVYENTTGNYYGTTRYGGKYGRGTIYMMSPLHAVTTIYSFSGVKDGAIATGTLILVPNPTGAAGGLLFGTTYKGGRSNLGVVFRVLTTGASYTVLHHFAGPSSGDGANPWAGVIQATDGHLYGTTVYGGKYKLGSVYTLTTTGAGYSVIHSFSGLTAGVPIDGAKPYARLLEYDKLKFAGATALGGSPNQGVLFTINSTGLTYTLAHQFASLTGSNPMSEVINLGGFGANAYFSGTTHNGGKYNDGVLYAVLPTGGSYTIWHDFGAAGDAANPWGAPLLRSDGYIYGPTLNGGKFNHGAVYRIKPGGSGYVVYYSFMGPLTITDDGGRPWSALLESPSELALIGTASEFGLSVGGIIFKLP